MTLYVPLAEAKNVTVAVAFRLSFTLKLVMYNPILNPSMWKPSETDLCVRVCRQLFLL